MRNLLVVIVLALLLTSIGCSDENSYSITPNITIKGSGNLVSAELSLDSFHSVHITTAGLVNITSGTKQTASLTVDDNILEHLLITASNGILVIGIESGKQLNDFDLTLELTMTDLEELSTSSAGTIVGRNKSETDEVIFNVSSAGSISLEIEAEQIVSNLSSAGSLELSGNAKTHHATISSVGSLISFGLVTESTFATLTSVGNAEVYTTQTLNVMITSLGSVFYKGNPIISQVITSLGIVVNAN